MYQYSKLHIKGSNAIEKSLDGADTATQCHDVQETPGKIVDINTHGKNTQTNVIHFTLIML